MRKLAQGIRTARAFIRLGCQGAISYPLSFVLTQLGTLVTLVLYFFMERIVRSGNPAVGGNFLTFVLLGIVGQQVVMGGFQGLGLELGYAVTQGRLEMLLIEPISWRLIPIGLALWPMLSGVASAIIVFLVGLGLGARMHFTVEGAAIAVLLVILGALAGTAMGVVASSVRVLAKRSDPVWTLYLMAGTILAGQVVPINVLPAGIRALAWLLPSTYFNSGIRKALMLHAGHIYGPGPIIAVLILVGFNLVMYPLGVLLVDRSFEAGRRLGVLASY
jgi:ABC-2 type transport system permease protein